MVIDPSFNKGGLNPSTTGSTKANSPAAAANVNTDAASSGTGESVHLSARAKIMAQLEAQVKQSPEVNEGKVEAVKTSLANGTYSVDSRSIAEKMIAQEFSH